MIDKPCCTPSGADPDWRLRPRRVLSMALVAGLAAALAMAHIRDRPAAQPGPASIPYEQFVEIWRSLMSEAIHSKDRRAAMLRVLEEHRVSEEQWKAANVRFGGLPEEFRRPIYVDVPHERMTIQINPAAR